MRGMALSLVVVSAVLLTVDEGLLEALDQACPSFDVGPDAKLSDVVRAAFVEVDEDKDGQLNQTESANFAQLIDVLNYCAELRKWGKIQ
nr:hypothetical protein BaRGS_021031 [Batillaria attramentaria]